MRNQERTLRAKCTISANATVSSYTRWAERAIGVLTATAMLHGTSLPKKLWAEAFSMATYLRNRTPTRALDGLTPFELLYGMKPDLAD